MSDSNLSFFMVLNDVFLMSRSFQGQNLDIYSKCIYILNYVNYVQNSMYVPYLLNINLTYRYLTLNKHKTLLRGLCAHLKEKETDIQTCIFPTNLFYVFIKFVFANMVHS